MSYKKSVNNANMVIILPQAGANHHLSNIKYTFESINFFLY